MTNSSGSSFPRLPSEILTVIVQFCYDAYSTDPRYCVWNYAAERRSLQSLCSVSRRMRDIVLPKLYETIQIEDNPEKVVSFLQRIELSPELAPFIKNLEFSSKRSLWNKLAPASSGFEQEPSGWEGLQRFQNLKTLALFDEAVTLIHTSFNRHASGSSLFPHLKMCSLQYGWSCMEPTPLELPVSCLAPFWNSPRLFAFAIGQFRLRIMNDRNTERSEKHSPGKLAELEILTISCLADVGAIQELFAVRKVRTFMYMPKAPYPGQNFSDYTPYLDSNIQSLSYLWDEEISTPELRYPDLSGLSSIRSVELYAQSLADLSVDMSGNSRRSELRCKLPNHLQELKIRVATERTSSLQFYNLIMDLLGASWAITNLRTIELDFGFAEVAPSRFYWNNRLISERERTAHGLQEADMYETDGQTVRHNCLRKACEQADIELKSEYRQMISDQQWEIVRD